MVESVEYRGLKAGGPLGLTYKTLGMKCLPFFDITSMYEDTSAQLSGRGELHAKTSVIALVTLRKCTLNLKRKIKMIQLVSTSTKGFYGGLSLDQVPQERQGSDFFLLPHGVLVDQASRTKEKGSNSPKITSENALNQPRAFPSVQRSLSHCRYH